LDRQGIFGTPQRNSASTKFFPREIVEHISDQYISVDQLSKDLTIPKATIQFAARTNYESIDAIEGVRLVVLIKKSDIEIIQKEIILLDSAKSDMKSNRLRYTEETEDVIHIKGACEKLGKGIGTVRAYRNIGAIRCHPVKHSLLSTRDVCHFQKDYATPSDLAKELEIPRRRVLTVLETYGVFPISGPLIDGKKTLFTDDQVFLQT